MRYIERILQPGERLMYSATVHWILFLPGIVLAALALAVLIWLWQHPPANQAARIGIEVLDAALAVMALASLSSAWLKRFSTEIDVTDRRVVYKRGLIRRHSVEMNMDKVESVDVEQTILGRILDYGDVTVRGTGVTMERVPMIERPLEFRNHVTAR